MEAVILAGGFGTRLRGVVPDLPKPMAPIAGRPFLEILLTALSRKGVRRAVLSLGHMADTVVRHFGSAFSGIELAYEIEDCPLGTGGAIRTALRRCVGDAALIVNGDTFLDLELDRVCAQWSLNGRPIIVGRAVADTLRYGRIETAEGRAITFAEKGKGGPGLINTGHYVFPTRLLAEADLPQSFSIETDYLSAAVIQRRFDVFVTQGQFIDIGVPEDYRLAQLQLAVFARQCD